MPTDVHVRSGRRRRLLLVLSTIAVSIWAVLLIAQFPEKVIAGDPPVYRLRVQAILEGGLPYFDVPFEHLPVMLVPMFAAWFLGGAVSQSVYVVVFAGLMGVSLAATTVVVDRLGEVFGSQVIGTRWLGLALPMLPLVIFRNDPVSVLLATIAMLLLVRGSPGWVPTAATGALAKIWPVALALPAWRRSRLAAGVLGLSGVVAVAISYLPGFVDRRDAFGIHAETLLGALVGFWRTASGSTASLTLTTAAYIDVSVWVVISNALIGLAVVAAGALALSRSQDQRTRLVAVGTVVAGIILASPLFSLQYVLWLTPFLALSRQKLSLVVGFLLGGLTLGLAWFWSAEVLEEAWFFGALTIRNGLVIVSAAILTREVVT